MGGLGADVHTRSATVHDSRHSYLCCTSVGRKFDAFYTHHGSNFLLCGRGVQCDGLARREGKLLQPRDSPRHEANFVPILAAEIVTAGDEGKHQPCPVVENFTSHWQ